jgi:glycosyltransferase involved in cell wall biosynthesis
MDRMRIVFTGPFDPTLCDGVSSSIFDLSGFLKSRGHEVFIVSFVDDSPLTREILSRLTEHQPEIISSDRNHCDYVTNGIHVYFAVLPYSSREILNGHPGVVESYMNRLYEYKEAYFFAADDDCTSLLAHSMLKSTAAHFIHSPAISIHRFSTLPIFQTMLRNRTVFTVSKFAQRELQRTLNLHALVWPPFIDSNRFWFSRTNKRDWKIGYYSAGPRKGDSIINALATKMPDQQFIIMGRGYHPDIKRANVTHLGGIADLESFYAEISLLLVPSLIPEGFARVIMEASMNAIPVIGNKIGGIPEALGPSGILIDTEASEDTIVGKYVSAITRLVSDPDAYEKYSKKAVERAQEYEKELHQTSISLSDIFLRKIRGIPDDNDHQTEFRGRQRHPHSPLDR